MYIKKDGIIEKASKLKEGEVDFIVSTNALDSHGERINVDGIDYKSYLKGNNVILWAHDGYNLPIGNAVKMWKDGNKLMARAKFYLKDEFPAKVYQYILDGVLKAVSIGGMVEEWGDDGLTIQRMNMKEFSVVSVPANPEAIAVNKNYDAHKKSTLDGLAKAYARKQFVNDEDEIMRNIESLETLVAALKGLAVGETKEELATSNKRVVLRQAQAVDQQAEKTIRYIKIKLKEK